MYNILQFWKVSIKQWGCWLSQQLLTRWWPFMSRSETKSPVRDGSDRTYLPLLAYSWQLSPSAAVFRLLKLNPEDALANIVLSRQPLRCVFFKNVNAYSLFFLWPFKIKPASSMRVDSLFTNHVRRFLIVTSGRENAMFSHFAGVWDASTTLWTL